MYKHIIYLSILLLPIDKNLILPINKNLILCLGNIHSELFFIGICEACKRKPTLKMREGDFQSTIDSVSTAMLCSNNRICRLKFSVPQEARRENNYLGKVSTEWQLSWSEY